MKEMAAGEFKAKCLAVMDEVQQRGEGVVITKRGKPVAKLVPIETRKKSIFGFGKKYGLKITGDIVSPIVREEDWDMFK